MIRYRSSVDRDTDVSFQLLGRQGTTRSTPRLSKEEEEEDEDPPLAYISTRALHLSLIIHIRAPAHIPPALQTPTRIVRARHRILPHTRANIRMTRRRIRGRLLLRRRWRPLHLRHGHHIRRQGKLRLLLLLHGVVEVGEIGAAGGRGVHGGRLGLLVQGADGSGHGAGGGAEGSGPLTSRG